MLQLSALIMLRAFYNPNYYHIVGYTKSKGIVYKSKLYDSKSESDLNDCANNINKLQHDFKQINFTIFY